MYAIREVAALLIFWENTNAMDCCLVWSLFWYFMRIFILHLVYFFVYDILLQSYILVFSLLYNT